MKKEDIMIELNDISMRFNLGIEKGFSLKQGFVDMFKKESYKSTKLLQLHKYRTYLAKIPILLIK